MRRQKWKDRRLHLEDQILAILNHMELSARQLERSWAEDSVKREEQEALKNQKALLIKNQQAEELAFKKLIENALRWKELKVLDEYLAELVTNQNHNPAFLEWLNWLSKNMYRKIFYLNFLLSNKD